MFTQVQLTLSSNYKLHKSAYLSYMYCVYACAYLRVKHYSGEVENIYISVRQIFNSGQYVPNFITIVQVSSTLYQKHFGVLFGFFTDSLI